MSVYETGLVAGPVSVPEAVRQCYLTNYGSGDIEPAFFDLYRDNVSLLQKLLNTKNSIEIMSGEGMVALWGALKSTIVPGDRVLCVSSGVFGDGFVDMARACGAETRLVKAAPGDSPSLDEIRAAFTEFKPKAVTLVMCETPAGLMNEVASVGKLCAEHNALFLVDFVSAVGGVEVRVDDWNIDIGMLGSQKCLSCLPDLAAVTVSERAWSVIEKVGYQGYDAILPWRTALERREFPYTPNWQANAALNMSLRQIFDEGLEAVFARHAEVAKFTRKGIRALGLKTYPAKEELNAETVTAVLVPEGWTWSDLDVRLREKGIVLCGSWGELAGKVFRIGHMGNQCRKEAVEKALAALKEILAKGR